MPEERLSDGEIRRTLKRHEDAIFDLAKTAVTQDAWTRENGHLRAEIKVVADDVADLKDQKRLRIGYIIAIAGVLATLLVGWWAAVGAAKGIH